VLEPNHIWRRTLEKRYVKCPRMCGRHLDVAGPDTVKVRAKCECGALVEAWVYPTLLELVRWLEWGLGEPSQEAWVEFYRRMGETRGGCDHRCIKCYGGAYVCDRCGHAF